MESKAIQGPVNVCHSLRASRWCLTMGASWRWRAGGDLLSKICQMECSPFGMTVCTKHGFAALLAVGAFDHKAILRCLKRVGVVGLKDSF